MRESLNPEPLTRRRLLAVAAAGLAGCRLGSLALAQAPAAAGGTVRDRLWIFTCAANSDFPHIGRRSVMTPAEGAFFLGVPNIIVVQSSESESRYGRMEPPLAPYTVALMLGCYVVDYGRKAGIPVSSMQLQCETGLRWLREGRIEGLIFLGNTTLDLGFESAEWTRQWIKKVGDTKL